MKIARLIIDDRRVERDPQPGTVIVKTADEALAMLERGDLDDGIGELCFDHDLGVNEAGEEITTRPFVDELELICGLGEREPIKVDVIYIHTSNPTGKKYIQQAFTNRHTAPHYPRVYTVTDEAIGLYDPNEDGGAGDLASESRAQGESCCAACSNECRACGGDNATSGRGDYCHSCGY